MLIITKTALIPGLKPGVLNPAQFLITKREANKILNARIDNPHISLDLGKSQTKIQIKKGIAKIDQQEIPLEEFKKVREGNCYTIESNHLQKLAFFSQETNIYYKLIPTRDWPTITLSSTPMHRHSRTSPKEDAISRIREIQPIKGKILDTCCGLGYSTIVSARNAEEVVTFEKDRAVLKIAHLNPYSQELFENKRIRIIEGDVFEGIKKLENDAFDRIIHDPPTFKYAPELYSKEFYQELYRVLKRGGIIYHYAPMPGKMKNKIFYPKIISGLKQCYFSKVFYKPNSSGIRAQKI